MSDKSQATALTLDEALDAAASEWTMQAALPDDKLLNMSAMGREAYLSQRLIGHLQIILLISGRLQHVE